MKYSILLLAPLLFIGCKKDELPFDVSEGTRLVKKEFYLDGTNLNEQPNVIRRFYYNKDGKLIKMETYQENLLSPSMKTEKQFDDLGNLSLMKFYVNKGEDNMTLTSFNEIYTNPETKLIEKISFFSIIDDSGIFKKTDERHLVYDDDHQLVADTVNLEYVTGSHSGRPTNFRYHWKDGNVYRIEKFDLDGKTVQRTEIDYDSSKNYRTWDLMRDRFLQYHNVIPKGKNNITKKGHGDFGAFSPNRQCNPCRTAYRYNSYGLPYFSRAEDGKRVIYTYERE